MGKPEKSVSSSTLGALRTMAGAPHWGAVFRQRCSPGFSKLRVDTEIASSPPRVPFHRGVPRNLCFHFCSEMWVGGFPLPQADWDVVSVS